MKSSIFALATAAALSLGMSSVAIAQDTTAQDTTTLLEPIVEDCPINTEGVETKSGVATPTGESLVDEDNDDMDGGDLEDGQIPVDECQDEEFTGIGDGAIDGTVDADDSGADSLTN